VKEGKVKSLLAKEAGYAIQLPNYTFLDVRPSSERRKVMHPDSPPPSVVAFYNLQQMRVQEEQYIQHDGLQVDLDDLIFGSPSLLSFGTMNCFGWKGNGHTLQC
jgi:hypothetical protein